MKNWLEWVWFMVTSATGEAWCRATHGPRVSRQLRPVTGREMAELGGHPEMLLAALRGPYREVPVFLVCREDCPRCGRVYSVGYTVAGFEPIGDDFRGAYCVGRTDPCRLDGTF